MLWGDHDFGVVIFSNLTVTWSGIKVGLVARGNFGCIHHGIRSFNSSSNRQARLIPNHNFANRPDPSFWIINPLRCLHSCYGETGWDLVCHLHMRGIGRADVTEAQGIANQITHIRSGIIDLFGQRQIHKLRNEGDTTLIIFCLQLISRCAIWIKLTAGSDFSDVISLTKSVNRRDQIKGRLLADRQ